jgi:hypothetical protein
MGEQADGREAGQATETQSQPADMQAGSRGTLTVAIFVAAGQGQLHGIVCTGVVGPAGRGDFVTSYDNGGIDCGAEEVVRQAGQRWMD